MKKKKISSKEFDKKFESGEELTENLDLSNTRKPNKELKRVNVDFPIWVVEQLDGEANRLGVTRQSLIKIWIAERVEKTL